MRKPISVMREDDAVFMALDSIDNA